MTQPEQQAVQLIAPSGTPVTGTAASGAIFNITAPTAANAGDYLVLVIANAGTTGPTAGYGWVLCPGAPFSAGNGQSVTAYYAVYDPVNTSLQFSNANSAAAWVCASYGSGGNTVILDGNPVAAYNTTNNSTLPTGAMTTGNAGGDYELLMYGWTSAATITGVAAGSAIDASIANGSAVSVALGHNTTTALGSNVATVAFSQTLSGNNNRKAGVALLMGIFIPAPITPTPTGGQASFSIPILLTAVPLPSVAITSQSGSGGFPSLFQSIYFVTGAVVTASGTTAAITGLRLTPGPITTQAQVDEIPGLSMTVVGSIATQASIPQPTLRVGPAIYGQTVTQASTVALQALNFGPLSLAGTTAARGATFCQSLVLTKVPLQGNVGGQASSTGVTGQANAAVIDLGVWPAGQYELKTICRTDVGSAAQALVVAVTSAGTTLVTSQMYATGDTASASYPTAYANYAAVCGFNLQAPSDVMVTWSNPGSYHNSGKHLWIKGIQLHRTS